LWTSLGNSQVPLRMVAVMRWDNLFDDLEDQLSAERNLAERDAFRDSLRQKNATRALLTVMDEEFWFGRGPAPVQVWTKGFSLWITVDNFGRDWIAGQVSEPRALAGYAIINAAAVVSLEFLGTTVPAEQGAPDAAPARVQAGPKRLERITLRILLRDLARRRKSGWVSADGQQIHGTIDRVGADFLELAKHPEHSARRSNSLESRAFLPLSHLIVFRLDD
jgi:hypothetical protein